MCRGNAISINLGRLATARSSVSTRASLATRRDVSRRPSESHRIAAAAAATATVVSLYDLHQRRHRLSVLARWLVALKWH